MDIAALRALWPLEKPTPSGRVSVTLYADERGFALHCNYCSYILVSVPWSLAVDLDAQHVLNLLWKHTEQGKHEHA